MSLGSQESTLEGTPFGRFGPLQQTNKKQFPSGVPPKAGSFLARLIGRTWGREPVS